MHHWIFNYALMNTMTIGGVQNVGLIFIMIIVMMSTKKLSRMMAMPPTMMTIMKKLTVMTPITIADRHNHCILIFTLQQKRR